MALNSHVNSGFDDRSCLFISRTLLETIKIKCFGSCVPVYCLSSCRSSTYVECVPLFKKTNQPQHREALVRGGHKFSVYPELRQCQLDLLVLPWEKRRDVSDLVGRSQALTLPSLVNLLSEEVQHLKFLLHILYVDQKTMVEPFISRSFSREVFCWIIIFFYILLFTL